jgi:hypothetical protein
MSDPAPKRKEIATGIVLNSNSNSSNNSSNSNSNSNSSSNNNLFNRNNSNTKANHTRKVAQSLRPMIRPSQHMKRNYFQPSNIIHVNVNEMNAVQEVAGGPNRKRVRMHPTRRVRNIPSEGKSRSNYRGHRTRTRRKLGPINSHPVNATTRAVKQQAAKLLADAHAHSNTYNEMVIYIARSPMNRQIKEIALLKLSSGNTYKNLIENQEEEWDPYA